MSDFTSFITLVASINDPHELEDFLLGVTTSQERHALVQRVEIVRRLLAGEPQLKIAQQLGVGVATVTRGSKEIAAGRFRTLRKDNV